MTDRSRNDRPLTRIDSAPTIPARPSDGHKGTFGRILIIAGSRGMSGAAALAGQAALRAGGGLVFVASPDEIVPIIAGYEPSFLTVPLTQNDDGRINTSAIDQIIAASQGMSAVAVGPGCGPSPALRDVVCQLWQSFDGPLVLDADALNVLAETDWPRGVHGAEQRLITPHPGELARISRTTIARIEADRQRLASGFAAEHNTTVLLKGPATVITDGSRIAVNETGNSGLATGGSGDVLTGVIASLLGQGMPAFEAAQLGAWVHGTAAEIGVEELSERGLIASDLPRYVALAWNRLSS